MDFSNIIRGFFGFRQPKRDNFGDDCTKCQDHECCEESCEESMNKGDEFFRDGDGNFFSIVQPQDPFSIFQQMEDAFNNFFSFHSGRMLDLPPMEEPFNDHESHDFFRNPSDRNFDIFLKDGHKEGSEFSITDSLLEPKSPRDLVLKPSYRDSPNSVEPTFQQDSDLDDALLKGKSGHGILKEFPQQPKIDMNWSVRKSVSIRTVRGRDGTVEEHRTVRDSSGNEVTTVRKSIGDQSYSVTLHKDHEGVKEKKEEFVNLDEKDVPQFQEKWHSMKDNNTLHLPKKDLSVEPDALLQGAPGDPLYTSIFTKLFRF